MKQPQVRELLTGGMSKSQVAKVQVLVFQVFIGLFKMSMHKDLFSAIPSLQQQGIDTSALKAQNGMFGATEIKSSFGQDIATVHESFGGIQRITDHHGAVIGQIRDDGLFGQTVTSNLGESLASVRDTYSGGISMSTPLGSPIANLNDTEAHFNMITDATGSVLGTTSETLSSVSMTLDVPTFDDSAFDALDSFSDVADVLDWV